MGVPYTDEDIERSLTALAVCGSSKAAVAYLKASANPIAPNNTTILAWAREHPERWERIKAERARLIDEHCIDEFRTVVVEGVAATRLAIAKAVEQLEKGNARYPDNSALNLAKATATYADKLAALLGKPTHIVEHRSTADVFAALERDGLLSYVGAVDGEATEEPATGPEHDEGRPLNGDRPSIAAAPDA